MNYIVGSDKKTAQLAANLIAKINAAMESGNFSEAEKLIDTGCNAVNRPFRSEFVSQATKAGLC